MREVELEFPSKATEAKKYFYFHHKKQRIMTTLILRVFIIRATQTLYCADISLMRRKFSERKLLRLNLLQFQPLYPKIVLIVKINKLQELIMNILYFKSCFISMFLSNQCKNISIARTNSTKTGRKLSTIFLRCWIAKTENSPKI